MPWISQEFSVLPIRWDQLIWVPVGRPKRNSSPNPNLPQFDGNHWEETSAIMVKNVQKSHSEDLFKMWFSSSSGNTQAGNKHSAGGDNEGGLDLNTPTHQSSAC